ncbi:GNAT family N-acetyltransferase [Gemmobacter denitrificans]|uniref:GNAT family N-acetyltransferase n=1 Tax=Gemmobacter denitrificans TaxID=3123040 RepID=A0ABU8BQN1_9RHOB
MEWHEITDPDDWQAQAGPALQQAWAYGVALGRLGAQVRRGAVIRDGRALMVAQMLERRRVRLIHQPHFPGPASRAPLRRMARHLGATIASCPLTGPGVIPLVTARHHAILDLRPAADSLRRGLHGKWRNRLLASRITPAKGRERHLSELLTHEGAQSTARGYRGLPMAFAQAWPGATLMLHWSPRGQMQAGMLFLIHGRAATYHCGWTSEEGRKAEAHRALLWQAILRLQAGGIERLDLGAVDSDNPGLARFKLGTGAMLENLGPTSLILP